MNECEYLDWIGNRHLDDRGFRDLDDFGRYFFQMNRLRDKLRLARMETMAFQGGEMRGPRGDHGQSEKKLQTCMYIIRD